jgi:microcompartment protein CcmK/EutM
MIVGTVTGQVYATIAHPFYRAKALLLVEREDATGARTGAYVLAVDTVGAGLGQRVLVLEEGTGARQVMASADGPVKSVIVGIVDELRGS